MVVHFICRANALRSLIAETYLKSFELPNLTVISSGVITDAFRESDRPFFEETTQLLTAHGLEEYIKDDAEQLTQSRVDDTDVIVVMNDRAFSEAQDIVTLPKDTIVWDITDIGEGARTSGLEDGRQVEEVIYDEIIVKVDELVKTIA